MSYIRLNGGSNNTVRVVRVIYPMLEIRPGIHLFLYSAFFNVDQKNTFNLNKAAVRFDEKNYIFSVSELNLTVIKWNISLCTIFG